MIESDDILQTLAPREVVTRPLRSGFEGLVYMYAEETGGSAILSNDGHYRYALGRRARPHGAGTCMFVMFNPSTADATEDDATIRRCVGFATDWLFKHLVVVNLFPYRATDPVHLQGAPVDPAGPGLMNRDVVAALIEDVGLIVAAWGSLDPPENSTGVRPVLELLKDHDMVCLGRNANGSPRHPLRLRRDTERVGFRL